jgi:hypothetical protein
LNFCKNILQSVIFIIIVWIFFTNFFHLFFHNFPDCLFLLQFSIEFSIIFFFCCRTFLICHLHEYIFHKLSPFSAKCSYFFFFFHKFSRGYLLQAK